MKNVSLVMWVVFFFSVMLSGCGVVGPPLPPEEIGIEAKLREQEQIKQPGPSPEEKAIVPIKEDAVVLPPIQPTRAQ